MTPNQTSKRMVFLVFFFFFFLNLILVLLWQGQAVSLCADITNWVKENALGNAWISIGEVRVNLQDGSSVKLNVDHLVRVVFWIDDQCVSF